MKLINKKFPRTALIALGSAVLCSLLFVCGVFNYPENKVYDTLIKQTAELSVPSDDIMLILLDQESIDWAQQELGWSWPWPRKAYADIVNFLADGGANSLAFDVMFTEPSVYGDADDEYFAKASAKFAGVIHTVFLSEEYGNTSTFPNDIKSAYFDLSNFSPKLLAKTCPPYPGIFPIKTLRSTAGGMGNIRSTSDADDIIRRSNLFYMVDGKAVPSLGMAQLLVRDGKNETLTFNPKNQTATLMGKTIPVDKNCKPLLRFRGDLDRYIPYNAMQVLSSWYALKNGEEPVLLPEDFANKYVFFGFYAPGLFDLCTTPISSKYPGVGVHITMLDNFLQDDFIYQAPLKYSLMAVAIAAFLGAFSLAFTEHIPFIRKHALVFSLFVVAALTLVLIFVNALIFTKGLWLALITPATALVFSYMLTVLADYAFEGKQKKYLKSAFKQYLSPAVIDQLILHPDRLRLGGERKEISVYFSDLQGFTSISEKMEPEVLTSFLNDYLSAMSDVILKYGGTIDKYEGDAIIAFWNAPTEQKDHAQRALEASMECQRILAKMRPDLATRAKKGVYMRIGLNTGVAVVGNMGSRNRFDYTMLGDSVNLASRLEGQNKQFGTYTMCTKSMKEAAEKTGCHVKFRELAKLEVVGKSEAVTVYQPLLQEEYEELKDILPIFDAGLKLFYKGELQKALEVFEKIKTKDEPAARYCQKCTKLLAGDLSDWQPGVWVADTK